MTDALTQAREALNIGHDCAITVAETYHAAMKGYRPERHAQVDADVATIEAAIAAIDAQLRRAGAGNDRRADSDTVA